MRAGHLTVWLILLSLFSGTGCTPSMPGQDRRLAAGIESPAPDGSRQHHLTTTADGQLLLSWVEATPPVNRLRFSILGQQGWTAPATLAQTSAKFAAPPKVVALAGGSLAAAWMVAAARGDDKYAADIYVSHSADGGKHWSEPTTPYSSNARIYDAQMSLTPLANGQLALVWTDTRNLKSDHRHQLMASLIDSTGRLNDEVTLDDDVCSCCETGIAAQGDDWLVAYRDHLPGEVRDIALVGSRGGHFSRSLVYDDHWVIDGCPSNGPDVAWKGSRVIVAWFSAADGRGRVRAAFSDDNGNTFSPPLELDDNANGYVSVLLTDDGDGIVAWRRRAGSEEALRVAKLGADGASFQRVAVYQGDFPRWPSRHLKLANLADSVYVAWNDLTSNRVRLAQLPVFTSTTHANRGPSIGE